MLERDFSNIWDSSTIGEAPLIVKMRNNEFGGPRSDHLFFFTDPSQNIFIFGVWWPWATEELSLFVSHHLYQRTDD